MPARPSGTPSPVPPSPADLEAAKNRTIPDVLPTAGEQLLVLFCGINPSLYSAAVGWHFARPGNRFWPALHLSGFTPRRLAPSEQHLLPGYGVGLTNLVARATAQAAELSPAELKTGGERLQALVAALHLRGLGPRVLAIAGVTAYRAAFARPRAATGPQPTLAHPWAPPPSGSSPTPAASTPPGPCPGSRRRSGSCERRPQNDRHRREVPGCDPLAEKSGQERGRSLIPFPSRPDLGNPRRAQVWPPLRRVDVTEVSLAVELRERVEERPAPGWPSAPRHMSSARSPRCGPSGASSTTTSSRSRCPHASIPAGLSVNDQPESPRTQASPGPGSR